MLEWAFRNRRTGRITIGQRPNAALGLFLVASLGRWWLRPSGGPGRALDVVTTGALVVWAVDEMIRGVNPWRRCLGGGVLTWTVVRLAVR
jgi:hypothetical protein